MLHKKFIKKITLKQRRFFMFSFSFSDFFIFFCYPWRKIYFLLAFFRGFFCLGKRTNSNNSQYAISEFKSKGMERRLLSIYILIIYYFLLRSFGNVSFKDEGMFSGFIEILKLKTYLETICHRNVKSQDLKNLVVIL